MPRTSIYLLALATLAAPALAQGNVGPTSQTGYPQQYQQQYAPQQSYPQQYSQQGSYPQQGYADPNTQGYAAQPYDSNGGQVIQVQPSEPQGYQQAPVQTDNEMVVPAPYAYPPAIGYAVPYPYPVGVGIGIGFGYPGYAYRGYPYYRGYIGRPGFYGGYRGGYVGGGYRGGYAHFGGRGGRR